MTVARATLVHVAFACLTGMLTGYSLCFIGALLVDVQRTLQFCFPCPGDSDDDATLAECSCFEKDFAVSCVSITAIAGGLLGGSVSDRIGRRRTLMLLDVLFISGSLSMAMSTPASKALFFLGRMFTGLAVGGGCAATAYIAEISPDEVRGMLVEINELFLGIGCVTAAIVGYLLGDGNWRTTVCVMIPIASLQLFAFSIFLYESPAWLTSKGREEASREAAQVLHLPLPEVTSDDEAFDDATDNGSLKAPRQSSSGCVSGTTASSFAPDRALRKRRNVLRALGCGLFHAMTGTNTMLYYSRNILARVGIQHALLGTLAVDAMKLLGIGVCVACVERCGRKRLLLIGSSGIVLGHAGLAVSFHFAHENPSFDSLALVFLVVLIFFWNISWSGLMLVVASELVPTAWRGLTLGAVYSTYWAVSGMEEQTLPALIHSLSMPGTFSFYGAMSLCTLLFVASVLPETGQTKLGKLPDTDLEESFSEGSNPCHDSNQDSQEESCNSSEENSPKKLSPATRR